MRTILKRTTKIQQAIFKKRTTFRTIPNHSEPIYTNRPKSTRKSGTIMNHYERIYTNLHESAQSRFKALQALFLADIAHYNYKSSCGLSKGLKMLASMILSPLSKVVLEAWGKCVLGYTLLPNCCAENGLHPCTIFQVWKPNSPKCTNLGSCDHPQASLANGFCAHKNTTCYSQEKGKSKKSLHPIKTFFFRISPPPPPPKGLFSFLTRSAQSIRMERERPPGATPLNNKKNSRALSSACALKFYRENLFYYESLYKNLRKPNKQRRIGSNKVTLLRGGKVTLLRNMMLKSDNTFYVSLFICIFAPII